MLAPALHEALHRAGLKSVAALARKIGYQPQTLWAVVSGVRACSEDMAARVGDALGLPASTVQILLRGPS